MTICIITVSAISDDISLDVCENAVKVYQIKRKLDIKMQIYAVSKFSGDSYCNHNVNKGTATYAGKLIFIRQAVRTSDSRKFCALFICCKR